MAAIAIKDDHVELYLYGSIGGDISAIEVVKDIKRLDKELPIDMYINSPGGDVYGALSIMNALRNHGGEVTAFIEGIAASAASFLAVGGASTVIMWSESEMMIHGAWTQAVGNSSDLRKRAEDLERITGTIAGIYAEKAGKSTDYFLEIMDSDRYLSAAEAVEIGLADEIRGAADTQAAASSLVMASIYKKRINNIEDNTMTNEEFLQTLAEMLGITEEPTEELIIAALEEVLKEQEEEKTAAPTENESKDEVVNEEVQDEVVNEQKTADIVVEMTTIPMDLLVELKEQAKLGREVLEKQRQDAIKDEVKQWVAEGRISAAMQDGAIAAMQKNENAAREIYSAIPENTVPRNEIGTVKDQTEPDDLLSGERQAVRAFLSTVF